MPAKASPSAKIVEDHGSLKTVTVTDSKGRVIVWREPDLLEQSDLTLAVGSEGASNPKYMEYVYMTCPVRSIDGVEFAFPTKQVHVRNAIKRLGTEGVRALEAKMNELQEEDVTLGEEELKK